VTRWAEQTGQRLFLGEVGVGTDATGLSALNNMLQYMNQHTDVWQGVTYWAGGPWWGAYMYRIEPQGLGTSAVADRPQMVILAQVEPDKPIFLSTAAISGADAIEVDLQHGTVSLGGTPCDTFVGVQGVQLGSQSSLVLGHSSGVDLLYGGSGADTFQAGGACDIIQGGTGTNTVLGGSGTTIFYGNGGSDTVTGGTGGNYMQGGSALGSLDVFNGSGGSDFVYGEGGAITLNAGTGWEYLQGGSGLNTLVGNAQHTGFAVLAGTDGTDIFEAAGGVNVFYEGTGKDTFHGGDGIDFIYGGRGESIIHGGSGTDVITTGAGNQYVQAGSGHTYFNDTGYFLAAGRCDRIDGFGGGQGTDLYLPAAVQALSSFREREGGTAVLTAIGGGTAEVFAGGADLATVQAHTHFTL
jgi:Ca2+-binding RTX toxin-like protein